MATQKKRLRAQVTVGHDADGNAIYKWANGRTKKELEANKEELRRAHLDEGFRHADILTYVAAGGQIAAGALLVIGLFTPIAAAGALGYLITSVLAEATLAHEEARLSSFLTDGHEYQVVLVCAVAAIILVGPGRYGLDAGRGWARRPFVGSFAALLLGIGAGVAIWVLLNGTNPLA